LIPGILRALGVSMTDIVFDEDVLNFIIDNYTYEGGVRRLKEKLFDICRELNIRHLLDRETYAFPYHVTTEFLENDIFIEQPLILTKCILGTPRVGLTNGMYASAMGVGGITIIECFIVPKSTFMTLELTGQQGDVMKESMAVARTVAWNLLNASDKKTIYNASKKGSGTGLHIHCPEGGTPKDGPSAGAAITTSIVSCLLKIPVCNTVAMTGEIDLNGQICQIGGLETKIRGAKKAGVTKIIVPRANTHDIHSMCTNDESPFADGTVSYVIVDTIWDVLAHVFPDSTYDFTRF
jgi:ATP-dependent Lon protease